MPFVFIGIGGVLVLTGLQGDAGKLYELVVNDFTGKNNFIYWFLSILLLGSLGYIESLKSLSRLFLALVIVVLLLDNKGFFAQLQAFINSSGQTTASTGGTTK